MSKRSPSADEDDHDQNFLGYGFQTTKSRKRSTDKDDGDRMKQVNGACCRHAVRGANVHPLEYFGATLQAEKFPLSANEKSFLEFTGTSDPKVARQYLNMTEGDLDAAVATYVDREVPCAPPSAVRDANASLVSVSEDLDSNSDEFVSSPRANDDAIMLWEKEWDDEERFLAITGTSDIDVAIRFLEMADGNLVTAVNIWRGVPFASLSVDKDDSDQKLPAARPAVLSMAVISSLTQLPRDDGDGDDGDDDSNDDDGDDDDDNDEDDDNDDDDDDDGGLNDINGISELELKRMRNVARNNARLKPRSARTHAVHPHPSL